MSIIYLWGTDTYSIHTTRDFTTFKRVAKYGSVWNTVVFAYVNNHDELHVSINVKRMFLYCITLSTGLTILRASSPNLCAFYTFLWDLLKARHIGSVYRCLVNQPGRKSAFSGPDSIIVESGQTHIKKLV